MRGIGSIKPNKELPFIIGVAGGSGSGKTYFAKDLLSKLGSDICEIVYQDNFYIDQSQRFDFDGGTVNFDHPSSIDFNFLAKCLAQLKSGKATEIPIYDFSTHKRQQQTVRIDPKPVVIVDGILIFHSEAVRSQLNELLFFETSEEIRFQRRLYRDIHERGRTEEGVRNQFNRQVKPMHDEFVEPSKRFANVIVRNLQEYDEMLRKCCERHLYCGM